MSTSRVNGPGPHQDADQESAISHPGFDQDGVMTSLPDILSTLDRLDALLRDITSALSAFDPSELQHFSSISQFEKTVSFLSKDTTTVRQNVTSLMALETSALSSALVQESTLRGSVSALKHAVDDPDAVLVTWSREFRSILFGSDGDSPTARNDHLREVDTTIAINNASSIHRTIYTLTEQVKNLVDLHDQFQQQFTERPFHVVTGNLYGLQPIFTGVGHARVNFDEAWVARYSDAMVETAEQWVNKNCPDHSLQYLTNTHIKLMLDIRKLFDREIWSFKTGLPATLKLFEDIKVDIAKEIEIENNQKFTIAFCGMVKAGYVHPSFPVSHASQKHRKSLFLNALTGQTILPSDGEYR